MNFLAIKGASKSLLRTTPRNFTPFQKCFLQNNYGIIAKFENKFTGEEIVIVNTQLCLDPEHEFVNLCETMYLLSRVKTFCGSFNFPIIFCGDLNSQPGNAAHTLLTSRRVDKTSVKVPWDICTDSDRKLRIFKFLATDDWINSFNFISSYTQNTKGEKIFTKLNQNFRGCTDYIFFTSSRFQKIGTIPLPSSINEFQYRYGSRALPCSNWPSDHLVIGTELILCPSSPKKSLTKNTNIGWQ